MTIDASVGSLISNSYVTVEEADLYFEERSHSSSWGTSTSKESLLITASRLLDWQLKFQGVKSSALQSMQFPRTGVVLSDGTVVPSDTIPAQVKLATYELAFLLISGDRTADSSLGGIDQVKAGSLFIKSVQGGYKDTTPKIIPDFIRLIISEFTESGSMSVVWLQRG